MSGLENANFVVSTFASMARVNQKGEIGFNEKTNAILVYKGQGWKGAHKIRGQAHVPGPYWTKMKPYVKWEKEYALQGQDSALRDLFTNAVRGVYGQQAYTIAADYLAYKPLTCYRVRRVFDRIEHNKAICQARFFAPQGKNGPLPGTYQALLASLQPAKDDTTEEALMFREFFENANHPALQKLAEKTFAKTFESGKTLTYDQRVEQVRKSIVTFAKQRQNFMKSVNFQLNNKGFSSRYPAVEQDKDFLFNKILWDQSVVTGISNEFERRQVMLVIKDNFIAFETNQDFKFVQIQQKRQAAMTRAIFGYSTLPTSFTVTRRNNTDRSYYDKRPIDQVYITTNYDSRETSDIKSQDDSEENMQKNMELFQNARARFEDSFRK